MAVNVVALSGGYHHCGGRNYGHSPFSVAGYACKARHCDSARIGCRRGDGACGQPQRRRQDVQPPRSIAQQPLVLLFSRAESKFIKLFEDARSLKMGFSDFQASLTDSWPTHATRLPSTISCGRFRSYPLNDKAKLIQEIVGSILGTDLSAG